MLAGLLFPLLFLLVAESAQLGQIATPFYIFVGMMVTAYNRWCRGRWSLATGGEWFDFGQFDMFWLQLCLYIPLGGHGFTVLKFLPLNLSALICPALSTGSSRWALVAARARYFGAVWADGEYCQHGRGRPTTMWSDWDGCGARL